MIRKEERDWGRVRKEKAKGLLKGIYDQTQYIFHGNITIKSLIYTINMIELLEL
jgi:hypothetical protein